MPRPSLSSEQKQQMRSRIRDATIALIQRAKHEQGKDFSYKKLTIRDVCKEAGISLGLFYKYYESREDLARSLWAEPVDVLRQNMQVDVDRAETAVQKIRVLLDHYARFARDNPEIFRGAFLFVRPQLDKVPEKAPAQADPFFQNLVTAFELGQTQGEFRQFDTKQMAQVFWAGIHGALALPVNLDRFDFANQETLPNSMVDTLLSSIMA